MTPRCPRCRGPEFVSLNDGGTKFCQEGHPWIVDLDGKVQAGTYPDYIQRLGGRDAYLAKAYPQRRRGGIVSSADRHEIKKEIGGQSGNPHSPVMYNSTPLPKLDVYRPPRCPTCGELPAWRLYDGGSSKCKNGHIYYEDDEGTIHKGSIIEYRRKMKEQQEQRDRGNWLSRCFR